MVELWARAGKRDAFNAFETAAQNIIAEYGVLRAAFRPNGHDTADEIHVIEFADVDAFDRYRTDPRVGAMATERDACIERTRITTGGHVDFPTK